MVDSVSIDLGKPYLRLIHGDPNRPYFDPSLVHNYFPTIFTVEHFQRGPREFIPLHLYCNPIVEAFRKANPPIPMDEWLTTLPTGAVAAYDEFSAKVYSHERHPLVPAAFLPRDWLGDALLGLVLSRSSQPMVVLDMAIAAMSLFFTCRQSADFKFAVHHFELRRRLHHDNPSLVGIWIADYGDFTDNAKANQLSAVHHKANHDHHQYQTIEARQSAPDPTIPKNPHGFCFNYWQGKNCTSKCTDENGVCRFKWVRWNDKAGIAGGVNKNPNWKAASTPSSNKSGSDKHKKASGANKPNGKGASTPASSSGSAPTSGAASTPGGAASTGTND